MVALAVALIDQNMSDAQAVSSADKEVLHGHVVEIFDLVRHIRCKRFVINVQPEDEKPGKGEKA